MYVLGYVSNENRLYLGDKEMSIVSFELALAVLEYQTAVMRKDFDTADQVLPTVPKEQRTRVAHFLEKQVRSRCVSVQNQVTNVVTSNDCNYFRAIDNKHWQLL
jgi:hypothetical protein